MNKESIFIVYFSFLFMVAIATMLRGEREFIRKEKERSARIAERRKREGIYIG